MEIRHGTGEAPMGAKAQGDRPGTVAGLPRYLPWREVIELTGMSRSTLKRAIRDGGNPRRHLVVAKSNSSPSELARFWKLSLDEFAELGRLQPVEQALTLLRGYGVRLWLLVQDFAQIRASYRQRADSILANVAVLQSFGTSDLTTAEYLSRKSGQTTVTSGGENRSTGHSYGRTLLPTQQRGQAHSTNQTGRPLLTPDEVMRLDPAHESSS
jgi:type IV secretory pathway TraG/TraD family ATPase VirD4